MENEKKSLHGEVLEKEEIEVSDLPELTIEKQRLFVKEYLVDMNATRAAQRAGYATISSRNTGSRLLNDRDVSLHIQYHLQERAKRIEVRAEDIVKELAGIGLSRITDFVRTPDDIQEQLQMLDPEDFDSFEEYKQEYRRLKNKKEQKTIEEMGNSVAALDSITIDKHGDTHISMDMKSKIKALELLGKHIGMWNYEQTNDERDRESNVDRIRRAIRLTRNRVEQRERSEKKSEAEE